MGGTAGALIGRQMDRQAREIEQNIPGATVERIRGAVKDVRGSARVTSPEAESQYRALEKYAKDIIAKKKAASPPGCPLEGTTP